MTGKMSVFLVEEHEIVRRGLAEMLRGIDEVELVACGPTVDEAATQCEAGSQAVVIVPSDVEADAVRRLRDRCSMEVLFLVLIRNSEPGNLVTAANLHADGYVLETDLSTEDLRVALLCTRNGQLPMPAQMAHRLLSSAGQRGGYQPGLYLTARERDVLILLADGCSNKQIARRLTISEHGAKRHVANILVKLGSPNRTLAAALAIRDGLIEFSQKTSSWQVRV